MKKIVVAVVVIVAILGIAFAAYSNSNSKNSANNTSIAGTNNVNNSNSTLTNNQNASTSNNTQSNISPAAAQKIATKYIETSGVKAGTPKLITQGNTQIYVVPLIDTNDTTVGEIDIDAKTGKNLGGAGGAP